MQTRCRLIGLEKPDKTLMEKVRAALNVKDCYYQNARNLGLAKICGASDHHTVTHSVGSPILAAALAATIRLVKTAAPAVAALLVLQCRMVIMGMDVQLPCKTS